MTMSVFWTIITSTVSILTFGYYPGFTGGQVTPATGVCRAILFGVSEYEENNLFNPGNPSLTQRLAGPKNDINAMEDCLTAKGWIVEKYLNPDADTMADRWEDWMDTIENGDECLVHFSGHGNYTDEIRYVLPSDANKSHKGELTNFRSIDDFQESLNAINGSGNKIFVLDCCANLPEAELDHPRLSKAQDLQNTYLIGYDGETASKAALFFDKKVGYLTQAVVDILKQSESLDFDSLATQAIEYVKGLPGFLPKLPASMDISPSMEYLFLPKASTIVGEKNNKIMVTSATA